MNRNELCRDFFAVYGRVDDTPEVFFAPGRVNLIGEHTDYNGGFVLPCALQMGTFMAIRRTEESMIRLASVNVPFRASVPLGKISVREEKQWINYPLGIFNQILERGIPVPGFEILYAGNIPLSSGLSSSASIEMVTAFALDSILEANLGMEELIRLSKKAENTFVGVNCGIMDMFAVGMGKKDHAIFLNCMTLEHRLVPLFLEGYTLEIADTNKPRGLAGSKYNERVAECRLAVASLSRFTEISHLGEISYMQFYKNQDQIPDEVIRKRARHVLSENQRVLNSVSSLWNRDILQFGALMNASHDSLRENYEVTGFELDTMVEEARKVPGVLGARMTGAGFGGCTVNLIQRDTVDRFRNEVGTNYHRRTNLEATFYPAEPSDGVHRLL